jgi:hypothetical protein
MQTIRRLRCLRSVEKGIYLTRRGQGIGRVPDPNVVTELTIVRYFAFRRTSILDNHIYIGPRILAFCWNCCPARMYEIFFLDLAAMS